MRRDEQMSWPVGIVAMLCGVCAFVAMQNFTLTGDDLRFLARWERCVRENGILAYPVFFCRHWLSTNGRMANELAPFLLSVFPKMLSDLLLGIGFTGLCIAVIRSVRFERPAFLEKSLLLFFVVVTLPWWDSLLLYDCWLNYPIAALFALLSLLSMRRSHGRFITVMLSIFAFVAGGMHEACGTAVSAGLVAWWFVNGRKKHISAGRLCVMLSFMAGACFALASPSIWERAGHEVIGARSAWKVLLISDFYTLILVAVTIVCLCTVKGRRLLRGLSRGSWMLFVVAAGVSSLFCAISGIIGRTGFFAQIFSLIALFRMWTASGLRINKIAGCVAGTLLLVAVCLNMISFAWWQSIVGNELKHVISLYRESSDGKVYFDFTCDTEIPFYTMHKQRGVPDPDDVWTLFSIADYYTGGRADTKPLLILPAELEHTDASSILSCRRMGADIISPSAPECDTVMTYERIPLAIHTDYAGIQFVVTRFEKDSTELYRISRRDIDPGD